MIYTYNELLLKYKNFLYINKKNKIGKKWKKFAKFS